MKKSEFFELKPDLSLERFIRFINERKQTKKLKTERLSVTYLDTFDWRLFKHNFKLTRENNVLKLREIEALKTPQEPKTFNIDNLSKGHFKAGSGMEKTLDEIIQNRALLPLAKIKLTRTEYSIQNANRKTVLQLIIDDIGQIGKFLRLTAIRGYNNQINSFSSLISEYVLRIHPQAIFSRIFKSNDKVPGDYDPKIKVQLKPEMRSDDALKLILKELLFILRRNEQGIIKDVDTEFLHDFRVAVRKTRAALAQIKHVITPEIKEDFSQWFRTLGKKTNMLRDIDVYLLNKGKYLERLTGNFQKDIEPFFSELLKERKGEHKKFCKFLNSKIYRKQMSRWNRFLSSKPEEHENAVNAEKPIINLAKQFIGKQSDKVLKLGDGITADSPDAVYHRLRIQCKKLRYLLEFFSSLFPQRKVSMIIVYLKRLQDNLGLFNDLSVQQKTLKEYSFNREFSIDVILSLGYLIGKLAEEQVDVKKEFERTFREFSSHGIKTLLKK